MRSYLKQRLIGTYSYNIIQNKTLNTSPPSTSVTVCFIKLKNLDFEELQMRLSALDPMMEREIEELRQRYTAKRQPILDAMDAKKRRQQNF